MAKTKIEWADEVWNPVTGCSKVSQGCKNCYAETIANRFWGERKFTDVQLHLGRLGDPLHWKKPRRVFVNSMSDLFHEDVPEEFIRRVLNICRFADRHTFMILTKRHQRMREVITRYMDINQIYPVSNLWLGVSVEDQATANERIPLLLRTPAAVRFVSVEPMLGPVELHFDLPIMVYGGSEYKVSNLDWVICGGESGPHARPMHPDWARGLRDQCQEAGVPFFFKQWGEWHCDPIYPTTNRRVYMDKTGKTFENTTDEQYHQGRMAFIYVGKKYAGRVLDGKTHEESPA